MNKDDAREAAEFEAKAKKFREERSKAWAEYIDLSSEAGYTIEDTLTNRTLFMGGYESGKDAGASSVDRRAVVELLQAWMDWYDGPATQGISYITPPLTKTRDALAEMEENNENSKM